MEGYEGVVFVAHLGTSNAANGVKAQQDTASGMGSAADLEGTQVLLDGTEETAALEIIKPRERYVRAVVVRGVSTTVGAVYAIQYGATTLPVDNDSSTDNSAESHVSPAEGTA